MTIQTRKTWSIATRATWHICSNICVYRVVRDHSMGSHTATSHIQTVFCWLVYYEPNATSHPSTHMQNYKSVIWQVQLVMILHLCIYNHYGFFFFLFLRDIHTFAHLSVLSGCCYRYPHSEGEKATAKEEWEEEVNEEESQQMKSQEEERVKCTVEW